MEGNSTNLVRDAAYEMDKAMAGVMPASWEGHARIALYESDDVPESIEEKALGKALGLSEKKGVSPKRAAAGLIKAFKKKQD